MITKLEYAQFSANVYRSSTNEKNLIGIPVGWTEYKINGTLAQVNDTTTGFEARAYTNGTEIVISYAGTDTETALNDIFLADGGTGIGLTTSQLKQSAEFYARVQQAAGDRAITFTGHSLGGGLAALMGVFFDKDAMTFDPAPFRAAAKVSNASELAAYLNSKGFPINAALTSYSTGIEIPIPVSLSPLITINVPSTISRETRVSAVAMQGEFLTGQGQSDLRDPVRIYGAGQYELVTHGNSDLGAIFGFRQLGSLDLHSMTLMVAMQASTSFRQLTNDLNGLLPALYDKTLFASETRGLKLNILSQLVRKDSDLVITFKGDANTSVIIKTSSKPKRVAKQPTAANDACWRDAA